MPPQRPPDFPPDTGLCRACRHARLIQSARGSVFVLCEAPAEFDLPKYPRLPVLACPAYALSVDQPDKVQSTTPR